VSTNPCPKSCCPPPGPIPEETRTRYIERPGDHPLRTSTEPIALTGAVERLPRAFVRCTGGQHADPEPDMERFAKRARAEDWPYREIPTSAYQNVCLRKLKQIKAPPS
jgi:hypothetical protein